MCQEMTPMCMSSVTYIRPKMYSLTEPTYLFFSGEKSFHSIWNVKKRILLQDYHYVFFLVTMETHFHVIVTDVKYHFRIKASKTEQKCKLNMRKCEGKCVLTISVPKDHSYSPYIFHEIQLDCILL